MPNIPQMARVWSDLGGAWVKSTKGAGATKARRRLLGGGSQHRQQDRLARSNRSVGAPRGARHLSFRPRRSDLSTTAAPHRSPRLAPEPRDRRRVVGAARLIAVFSGTVGLVSRSPCSALSNALAAWAARAGRPGEMGALGVLVAATLGDRRGLPLAEPAPTAEVPDPGNGLPDRLPDRPDRLHDRRRVHELLDRPHPHRSARRSTGSSATRSAARQRQVVRDGARARRGRRSSCSCSSTRRPASRSSAPRRGSSRFDERRQGWNDVGTITAAAGYQLIKGKELLALDQDAARASRCRLGHGARSGAEGTRTAVELAPTLRYYARRDTFTRIEDGRLP